MGMTTRDFELLVLKHRRTDSLKFSCMDGSSVALVCLQYAQMIEEGGEIDNICTMKEKLRGLLCENLFFITNALIELGMSVEEAMERQCNNVEEAVRQNPNYKK